MKKLGKVFLVGAGPGDPKLITLKGIAALKKAEVVVYDYLVNKELLDYAPPKAERICADKLGPHWSDGFIKRQGIINDLLVKKARQGKRVVRLKCGDPFIFGRGGEEADVLKRQTIPYEVIPGVTSAIAAPEAAGIPLTHRKFAASLAIVTGHRKARGLTVHAPNADTVVYLMGVENLPNVVKELIASGRLSSTPVAVIERGTWPGQRTVKGTLKNIVAMVKKNKIKPPSVVVVGKVAGLGQGGRYGS